MNAVIRPEIVARKFAALLDLPDISLAARFAREPRLGELLWFLQWQSMQPGGFDKFAADLVAANVASAGTEAMRRLRNAGALTAAEQSAILESFPMSAWDMTRRQHAEGAAHIIANFNAENDRVTGFDLLYSKPKEKPPVKKRNFAYFHEVSVACAVAQLPCLLAEFCKNPEAALDDPWCFHGLEAALFRAMAARAARVKKSIAETSVSRQVFDALDFASAERVMVEVIGSSRYGKTEAARAYCHAYPGRARLIKTPEDNTDRGLLEAILRSFGFDVPLRIQLRALKSAIELIAQASGFLLVFDESHFLYPQRYCELTIPMRLNCVRGLLDNGSPVALLNTPQFTGPAAKRFERKTQWNGTQWKGRIMQTITLPEELPAQDLLAVVRHHLPGVRESLAVRIIGWALLDKSFMFGVEKIVRNARYVARKDGREELCREDLETGARLAGIKVASSPTPEKTIDSPRVAAPREIAPPLDALARQTKHLEIA